MATCIILGSGVQGLTCALQLQSQGWNVIVISASSLSDTVSWGAGAIWEYPPFQVEPEEAAKRWVLASLKPFCSLAEHPGIDCGVRVRRTYYVYRDQAIGKKAFARTAEPAGAVFDLHEGLPPPGSLCENSLHTYGFSYRAPIVCMSTYLPWLQQMVLSLGGQMLTRLLVSEADVSAAIDEFNAQIVVNCLGLGASNVFKDASLFGVLGDLVYVQSASHVEQDFDLAHISDEDHPGGLAYVVPQLGGKLALAGTAIPSEYGPTGMPLKSPQEDADSKVRQEGILERCSEELGLVFGHNAEEASGWNWKKELSRFP